MFLNERTVFQTALKVLSFTSVTKATAAIIGLTISNIIEVVGLALLIPILSQALFSQQTHVSKKGMLLADLTHWLGLERFGSLEAMIGLFLCVLILKSALVILITRMNARIVAAVTRSIRIKLIRSLLGAKWEFFVTQKVGHLNNLVTNDASIVGETFDIVVMYCSSVLQIVMYIVLALVISWELAAFFLVLGPIIFVAFARLLKWSKLVAREHAMEVHTLSSTFVDVLVNMKAIKAMDRNGAFTRNFLRDTKRSEQSQRMKVFSADFAGELQEPIIAAAMVLFLILSVRDLGMTSAGVIVLGMVFVRTSSVFYNVQRMHHRIALRSLSLEAVLDTADEAETLVEVSSGTVKPALKHGIEMKDVSFQYPERTAFALQNCSLRFPAGSVSVIMGTSGAGKSTLLDLILGLREPTKGQVAIDGVPLQQIDLSAWRRMIGYVPQEASLFNTSVKVNVALGDSDLTDEKIWRALSLAGAADFVKALPETLDYGVGERGLALSGGQRQRIALARSLLHEPKLLVFDEATSALDPVTEEAIGRHLTKIAKELNLTVIAVTHRSYWMDSADQIITVENGVARVTEPPKDKTGWQMHASQ
jgi:ATP-binding cassette subfamily C protein